MNITKIKRRIGEYHKNQKKKREKSKGKKNNKANMPYYTTLNVL